MLVLILIFVPKQVKKFTAIKEGIEEVKSGNLSYKIPVEEDAKGIKGEFDRMAEGINCLLYTSSYTHLFSVEVEILPHLNLCFNVKRVDRDPLIS